MAPDGNGLIPNGKPYLVRVVPVSLKVLEQYGVTQDRLKELLSFTPGELPTGDPRKSLYDMIRTRIVAARNWSLSNWKTWYALDRAYDVSFSQITPTLLQSLEGKDPSNPDTQKLIDSFHLMRDQVMKKTKVPDVKGGGDIDRETIDIPAFFMIFVPIAKNYLQMRHAKIMSDYDQMPFMKFEPAFSTAKTRMQCEVTTSEIERRNTDMGSRASWSQFVFNYLHYGLALKFPREEWWQDCHLNDVGEDVIDKEGVRYHVPHPSRVHYDMAHPLSTFNEDTGCEYALYWKVVRFGDIRRNTAWWNTERVTVGSMDWWSSASTFFNTMSSNTAIKFPANFTEGNTDRESKFADELAFYGPQQDDKPCLQTELFAKIIPKEYGLGEYPYPVWFRFVVASEYSVLYAAPCGYHPVTAARLDPDENREITAGMTLDLIPFQDHFTQMMSQFVLTAKQNLTNITLVDVDASDEKERRLIDKIIGLGTKLWSKINFIPFSGRQWSKGKLEVDKIFHNFKPIYTSTADYLQGMRLILDTLERVLGITSQEVGQPASHELRVDEVRAFAASSATRVVGIKRPLKCAMMGWKRQVYDAWMAHGSDQINAEIPYEASITAEFLQQIGLIRMSEPVPRDNKIMVKGSKEAVSLLSFAAARGEDDRVNNVEAAAKMLGGLAQAMALPAVQQAVGRQVIPLLNEIFKMAGFPADFKLDDRGDVAQTLSQDQLQQVMQLLQQVQQSILGQVGQNMKPVVGAIQEIGGQQEKMQEAIAHIAEIIDHAGQAGHLPTAA